MSLWVRAHKKRINLRYAILAEEWDDSPETRDLAPGGLRLTLETGRTLVLPPGPDAEKILRTIDEEIDGRPGANHSGGGVARGFDPDSGAPLPREAVESG